jgi:DNA-directed RNA polymerase subunit RPC12/RpoP
VQLQGWRRSKFFKTQRIRCQDCGSWSLGTRVKVG